MEPKQGNLEAIKRKINGVLRGENGYGKNSLVARDFIESLMICNFSLARGIGKYLKVFAMKYGILELGYEKDRRKALLLIKEHHVPY